MCWVYNIIPDKWCFFFTKMRIRRLISRKEKTFGKCHERWQYEIVATSCITKLNSLKGFFLLEVGGAFFVCSFFFDNFGYVQYTTKFGEANLFLTNTLLNKSWRQHPTRHQLYGHLPPITKTIQVRRNRHAGHCWRSRDQLISDVLLWTHTYGQAKAGRLARTYIQQLCEDTRCSPLIYRRLYYVLLLLVIVLSIQHNSGWMMLFFRSSPTRGDER